MCVLQKLQIQIKSGGEGNFTHNKISKFEHLAYPVLCKFNEE